MKTAVKTRTKVDTQVAEKTFDRTTFYVLAAVSVAFGIFAFASLAGAVATGGLSGLAKGFLIAVSGV